MLKYNTFRSDRYLRSKFIEGRYFLASEASDMELEILDLLRKTVASTVGDVAIDNAWKVTRLTTTQLLIEPGEAWIRGLPFTMRSSSDQLVSGASLSLGTVPTGVTITDSASGAGKILTFTTATVPTSLYRFVVSAEEQIVTDADDPFLKNANLTESTSQKIRLVFKLNIITDSTQTETPIPYTPHTGAYNAANMVNQIQITPSSGQNGEVLLVNPISGQSQIDGRDLELTIRNDSSLGGGVKIPNTVTDQQAFYNGKLIDAVGNEYHINQIFNDTISTQVIIRLDKEVGQPNPSMPNGSIYKLVKRDVYVTDDVSGNPIGKLFWPIAKANWNSTNGFVHDSVITDLRKKSLSDAEFQDVVNKKINLVLVGGGVVGLDSDGYTFCWSSNFSIINPSGPEQQINANAGLVLVDGGAAVYTMNVDSGGIISVGNLSVTSDTFGSTVHFTGSPSLAQVKKGNILKIGSEVVQITAVNDVTKTVTVSPSTTGSGSGTIYRDSFAPGTVELTDNIFVLAVRKNSIVTVGGVLNLTAGSSNAIYDERIQYPTGYTASTVITLPNNSRNSNKTQYYSATQGNLSVYINQILKFQGTDWTALTNNTISIAYDLPNNSEIHFRIDSLPSGSVGGGSGAAGSLQAAYNIGNIVTTVSGTPFTINGPIGQKLLVVNGDVDITGVIDPSGLELTAQTSNPLSPSAHGFWVDTSGNLKYEKAGTTILISETIEAVLTGQVFTALSKKYTNVSGSFLSANTPVYSPGSGGIAAAGATTLTKAKCIGILTEDTPNGVEGIVAYSGMIENFTGFPHGALVYLDETDGQLTTTPSNMTGIYNVLIGVVEGNNLFIRPMIIGQA